MKRKQGFFSWVFDGYRGFLQVAITLFFLSPSLNAGVRECSGDFLEPVSGIPWAVDALAASEDSLFIGESFGTGPHLVSLDTVSFKARPDFEPDLNGPVESLLLSGEDLFVGTDNGVIALDPKTGKKRASFAPVIDEHQVFSMLVVKDTLYIGGMFESVNGQKRNLVAAIDRVSGKTISSFRSPIPEAQPDRKAKVWNKVVALAYLKGRLYMGGLFAAERGSMQVENFAELDPISGDLVRGLSNKPKSLLWEVTGIVNDASRIIFTSGWVGGIETLDMHSGRSRLLVPNGADTFEGSLLAGDFVLSGNFWDGMNASYRVYSVKDGRCLCGWSGASSDSNPFRCMAVSPDGRWGYVGGAFGAFKGVDSTVIRVDLQSLASFTSF